MRPRFTTAPMEHSTGFGPLVALGFWVRQQDLVAPVRSRVGFTEPTHCDDPVGALLDMGVGILAGCEVVAQVNRVYSKLVRDMAYYRCQDNQPFHTGAAPCLITQMPLYTSFMSSSNLC